jgi:nascent polypeptide-associated complex subunit alpha
LAGTLQSFCVFKHETNSSFVDGSKLNRGEKKCRKALLKIGMKQYNGVTRVTLRKRDGLIFVVNDPEVLRSDGDGKSFAVFGELKMEDPNQRLQQAEAKKFAEQSQIAAQKAASDAPKKADSDEKVDETGITAQHIDLVMDHTSCTRAEAVRALREKNDDMIQAVMSLTN